MAEASKCIDCGIPSGMRLSVLIYLWSQIAGVTDVQTLINNSRCYDCGIPSGMRESVLIYLGDAILANGGGSGNQEVWSLLNNDTPTMIVPVDSGVAYNEIGQLWVWNKYSLIWELVIV